MSRNFGNKSTYSGMNKIIEVVTQINNNINSIKNDINIIKIDNQNTNKIINKLYSVTARNSK